MCDFRFVGGGLRQVVGTVSARAFFSWVPLLCFLVFLIYHSCRSKSGIIHLRPSIDVGFRRQTILRSSKLHFSRELDKNSYGDNSIIYKFVASSILGDFYC